MGRRDISWLEMSRTRPGDHRGWVGSGGGGDFGGLSHLPASAMMVRSNTATSTVTPMGTFLSLMHLRLKPGEKPHGKGTASEPQSTPSSPQLPRTPMGVSDTLQHSHKARGGPSGCRLSAGGAFISLCGFSGLPHLTVSSGKLFRRNSLTWGIALPGQSRVYVHGRKGNVIFAFKKPGIPLFFQASLDFNSFRWPWRGVASITAPLQGVLSSNPRLGDPQMDGWMVHHVGGVGWSFKPTGRAWTPPRACGAPLKAPRQGDGAHVPASRAPSAIPGAAEGTSVSLSSTSRESRG